MYKSNLVITLTDLGKTSRLIFDFIYFVCRCGFRRNAVLLADLSELVCHQLESGKRAKKLFREHFFQKLF